MRAMAVLYFVAILALVVLADSGVLLPMLTLVHSVWWGDKALHLLLSLGLGFFATALHPRASLVLAPLVILEETSQHWIAGRNFDLRDMAANLVGVAIGTALALSWRRRRAAQLAAT